MQLHAYVGTQVPQPVRLGLCVPNQMDGEDLNVLFDRGFALAEEGAFSPI